MVVLDGGEPDPDPDLDTAMVRWRSDVRGGEVEDEDPACTVVEEVLLP